MKRLLKSQALLLSLLTVASGLLAISCSNGANGMDGASSKDGYDGWDGTICDFGEDGDYFTMVCGLEEKARWAKAYCEMKAYDPAKKECNHSNGVLLFSYEDVRDGKTYKAITIGYQTWMAENMNYAGQANAELGKCYNSSAPNCARYGRLYDWETANEVCPEGWHLPSREEWTELVFAAGIEATAGAALKAKSGWESHEFYGKGTDRFGFAALPGGYSTPQGVFSYGGLIGNWWSATAYEADANEAYIRTMAYDESSVNMLRGNKNNLFSVRCVENR
jgi:uncharacterized protein (TIGR02145 family)